MALKRNTSSNNQIKRFVIVLDAGHGAGKAHNRGSVCGNEGDNNFYYSLVLKREFEKIPGVIVKLTRHKITDNPSLNQRGLIGAGADLFLSLHSDAFSNRAVNGTTVFDSIRYPNRLLATKLAAGISSLFSHLNRGVQFKEGQKGWDWYGVLRNSKAKSSMIIEHGFHTNLKDCNYFKNNHNTIAKTTVNIIAKHYGLGGTSANKGDVNVSGNKAFYNINVNNSGFGVVQLQKDLVKLGYSVGSYGTNGIFGKDTKSAVEKFQKDNNLTVDGSAGPATLSKIQALLKSKGSVPNINNSQLEKELKEANDKIQKIKNILK